MPCYYPRAHLGLLLVLLLYWGRDTLFPPSPSDYHSIKVDSPFCEWPRPPCPSSLCIYLEDSWKLSFFFPSLSPSSVIAPPARDRASNWPLISYPLLLGLQRAQRQRTDAHLSPLFLTFLPIKLRVLNYSRPTLIVIDWNSRGSGRMTDRLSSLQARPPQKSPRKKSKICFIYSPHSADGWGWSMAHFKQN